jgi:23S rRNA U2552 (ribose-2'-O)-methylase RlmE/FtsJ
VPGGWSQALTKKYKSIKMVGVDLIQVNFKYHQRWQIYLI